MLSFKDLKIDKSKDISVDTSIYQGKPEIQYLGEGSNIGVERILKGNGKITLFNKPKPKIDKATTRLIEPGNKIPTGQFHSVSQWCDTCQEVQAFAHKPDKRRMICLTCKTIKTY